MKMATGQETETLNPAAWKELNSAKKSQEYRSESFPRHLSNETIALFHTLTEAQDPEAEIINVLLEATKFMVILLATQ